MTSYSFLFAALAWFSVTGELAHPGDKVKACLPANLSV